MDDFTPVFFSHLNVLQLGADGVEGDEGRATGRATGALFSILPRHSPKSRWASVLKASTSCMGWLSTASAKHWKLGESTHGSFAGGGTSMAWSTAAPAASPKSTAATLTVARPAPTYLNQELSIKSAAP